MAKILVTDDSKFQRRWIARGVQNLGHEIIEAENGQQSLEMVESEKPDCVITDLLMPVMGGIEFMQELAKKGSKVPVVVVTADIQEDTKKHCQDLGAVAFLNKPFDYGALAAAVSLCLTNQPGGGQ
jgi:CheY-like chemotaxis protein